MANMTDLLKQISKHMIEQIVDIPEEVFVEVTTSTKNIMVQVKVEKSDIGKVIGRSGRTIDAIRTILIAIKNTKFPEDKRKVLVEILEDEDDGHQFWNN